MLAPIWDESADKIMQEFPEPGRVLIGKVDCDKEGEKELLFFRSIITFKIKSIFLITILT